MDPDRCLEEMLSLSKEILDTEDDDATDCQRLAELVVAVDSWLSRQGFLPARWAQGRKP